MKTAKQIINAINFLNAEQKTYILENKLSHLPMNLERTKTHYNFISITDFAHIEQIKLDREDYRIWEIFSMFENLKTALNCMTAIAEGRKFNHKFFENQKNITAKDLKATNFTEFLNNLTPEQKNHLKTAISEWDKANLMENALPYLDTYQLNEGEKFKTGDYILYFDKRDNTSFYGRIFQAEKNGVVMITTAFGFSILDNQMTAEVVPAEKVPSEYKKTLDKLFDDYTETGNEFRDKFFSKLEKTTERAEKLAKKEEEAMEKKFTAEIEKATKLGMFVEGAGKDKGKLIYEGKAHTQNQLKTLFESKENLTLKLTDFLRAKDEATATAHADFMKTDLKTPESIENLLKSANQYNWSKKQKDELNGKIKTAKEEIKKALANKKDEPKAEEITAPEKVLVAKATTRRQPKKETSKKDSKGAGIITPPDAIQPK